MKYRLVNLVTERTGVWRFQKSRWTDWHTHRKDTLVVMTVANWLNDTDYLSIWTLSELMSFENSNPFDFVTRIFLMNCTSM